jgi:hypothetical protein
MSTAPEPAKPAINVDAARFHVREALKALEADVDGERFEMSKSISEPQPRFFQTNMTFFQT